MSFRHSTPPSRSAPLSASLAPSLTAPALPPPPSPRPTRVALPALLAAERPHPLGTVQQAALAHWAASNTRARMLAPRAGRATVAYVDGPPTMNGRPGVHHLLNRALKDVLLRHRWHQGLGVRRVAAVDTHGLPVERAVECALGRPMAGGPSVHPGLAAPAPGPERAAAPTLGEFSAACARLVAETEPVWQEASEGLGFWLDWQAVTRSHDPESVQTVWSVLARLYASGRLVESTRVSPWCPACATVLSGHEVAQGTATAPGTDAYLSLPLHGSDGRPWTREGRAVHALVMTSTPWTLGAHAGVAVHPTAPLALVAPTDPTAPLLLVGQAALAQWPTPLRAALAAEPDGPPRVLCLVDPATLPDLATGPALPGHPVGRLVRADWVRVQGAGVGTGLVHLAPAHGEPDAATGAQYGLAVRDLLDDAGTVAMPSVRVPRAAETEVAPPSSLARGTPEAVSAAVLDRLTPDADPQAGAAPGAARLWHVAHPERDTERCWRCETVLVARSVRAWYVPMGDLRAELLDRAARVDWGPRGAGRARFESWLSGARDWAVSRSRVWGTPLPLWRCSASGGHVDVVGSLAALRERLRRPGAVTGAAPGVAWTPTVEALHRPAVDALAWPCAHDGCAGTMHRVPEVLDTWFDSGCLPLVSSPAAAPAWRPAPWAAGRPLDLVVEGVDQTRGWFYSLLAVATALGPEGPLPASTPPYARVVVHDLVLDATGQKMAKSRGNTVDALELLAGVPSDVVRVELLGAADVGQPRRVDPLAMRRTGAAWLATALELHGGWRATLRARAAAPEAGGSTAGFPGADACPALVGPDWLDRWLLGRVGQLARTVTAALDQADPTRALRALETFTVADVSQWYARLAKGRLARCAPATARAQATTTLRVLDTALGVVAALLAPLAPHTSEVLLRELTGRGVADLDGGALPPGTSPAMAGQYWRHAVPPDLASLLDPDPSRDLQMTVLRRTVTAVRSLRAAAGRPHRTVLPHLSLCAPLAAALGPRALEYLAAEANVLQVGHEAPPPDGEGDGGGVTLRPAWRELGRAHGARAPLLAAALRALDPAAAARAVAQGEVTLQLAGSSAGGTEEVACVVSAAQWHATEQTRPDHEAPVALGDGDGDDAPAPAGGPLDAPRPGPRVGAGRVRLEVTPTPACAELQAVQELRRVASAARRAAGLASGVSARVVGRAGPLLSRATAEATLAAVDLQLTAWVTDPDHADPVVVLRP